MNIIILAAGNGKRALPATKDKPKCMININGNHILQYQMDIYKKNILNKINLVAGYQKDKIHAKGVELNIVTNENYNNTNMIYSLSLLKNLFKKKDDILISYGDIIFKKRLLVDLLNSSNGTSVLVDKKWKEYWLLRYGRVDVDIETLQYNYKTKKIYNIGQHTTDPHRMMARFVGLILVKGESKKIWYNYLNEYANKLLNKKKLTTLKKNNLLNMFTTDLLHKMIIDSIPIHAIEIDGGWVEIDNYADIKLSNEIIKKWKN
tara:strand:+ start:4407 stop:5192 length:786 start_codon:yes stop_codon:yes gene_type:complete